ncbi:ABC transporter permease [Lacrimispora sp. 210928-DFI.3.58]|uniref:ABC transporter permease n=1 Tax=Lacrimispora sp. 210928-DFI.3.58 TaxID=2883214 RepID=UPI0015B3973F|nr:ABC transporter permease [Lacrimispora sp. 210928-DFI.3.58]MCB7320621.1 ABC transporter permease [Lacrimispora sp. 210928-DFI.3.58]
MINYTLRRLLMLIPVLLGVSLLVFTIMELTPGDPVTMYLGASYTEEAYRSISHELGLDQPFLIRYGKFVLDAVRGDFGISYSTRQPVINELIPRLPKTIQLSFAAMLFAVTIGMPLGIISAVKQNSALDSAASLVALAGVSVPSFWLGIMLILIFAAKLGWFPSSYIDSWKALVLPAVTLSANTLAVVMRMTRSSLLETIRQDYIRTARAKGLKESVVIIKHGLRNAMIPIITTVGLQFGFSLGGAVLVETVFAWPGIGSLLVEAIRVKNTPIVLAIVVILATLFSIINLAIDILYAFFDPRIKTEYRRMKVKVG